MNLLREIQEQQAAAHRVTIDCEIWFGPESAEWTHEERVRKLTDAYDALWREAGGEGHHPMSPERRGN